MPQQAQRLDTNQVITYVKNRKSFTTDEVATYFDVSRGQAAASIAIMRIKNVVERAVPKTKRGSSHWTFSGRGAGGT
jgi:hypothetical protein